MKQHQYQVTLKHLADAKGQPSIYSEDLVFQANNHDDIFAIVQHMQKAKLFDDETTMALVVGMKLFGEVMLENREHPLFNEFFPEFVKLIKKLKNSSQVQIREHSGENE